MEYTYSLGRRKTSVATLRLYSKPGKTILNEKEVSAIYPDVHAQKLLTEPLTLAELDPKDFYFTAKIVGGGKFSQIDAVRLALARAIIKLYPDKKKAMKDQGLLTRDPRMVERKKPGLRKARRAEQYSKR
jgi:small subunit ribosomal protein S9